MLEEIFKRDIQKPTIHIEVLRVIVITAEIKVFIVCFW